MKALLKVKKVEDMLAHDKLSEVQKEEISQKEYIRGICDWNFNIEDTTLWKTSYTEVLTGWRGGDESVICDGVLYFLIYSILEEARTRPKPATKLIRFNLNNRSSVSKTVTTNIPFDEDAAKMSKALSNSDKVDMIKELMIALGPTPKKTESSNVNRHKGDRMMDPMEPDDEAKRIAAKCSIGRRLKMPRPLAAVATMGRGKIEAKEKSVTS
ncbi:hypothetical protein IFM89_006368 [Coptis chinensis]|uniref:Uncharacterized protein n=1 Tax=Coptis chinensis TaxID=261450 RepID=A0A835LYQ8_9MAGN|nr:hypothetical protein IFM89_006368 [Coptis chinensis]